MCRAESSLAHSENFTFGKPLKDKLNQDKPWVALGWSRKQWKRSKMWKKAGVTEQKMGQLLQNLDHDFVQEMKDGATAEALVEQMFGKAGD